MCIFSPIIISNAPELYAEVAPQHCETQIIGRHDCSKHPSDVAQGSD